MNFHLHKIVVGDDFIFNDELQYPLWSAYASFAAVNALIKALEEAKQNS